MLQHIVVNKCSVIGCLSNYKGHNTGAVFGWRSKVPSRKAGKQILMIFLDDCNVACAQHQEAVLENVIITLTNIFINNQRKRKTETVVKDRVSAFKKC